MLTHKKKLYTEGVFAGKTQTQAAIDAGFSKRSATMTGSRLRNDKDVKAYLKVLRQKKKTMRAMQKDAKAAPVAPTTPESTVTEAIGQPMEHPIPVTPSNKSNPIDEFYGLAVIKEKVKIEGNSYTNPLRFLEGVMKDVTTDIRIRMDAAKKLADLAYAKPIASTKDKTDKTKGTSKFASAPPPLKAIK